jgi:hypothetical protein
MKIRLIYIVVAAAVIIAVAAGSAPAQQKWYGGLKLGFNSSQFRGDAVAPLVYGFDTSGCIRKRAARAPSTVFCKSNNPAPTRWTVWSTAI